MQLLTRRSLCLSQNHVFAKVVHPPDSIAIDDFVAIFFQPPAVGERSQSREDTARDSGPLRFGAHANEPVMSHGSLRTLPANAVFDSFAGQPSLVDQSAGSVLEFFWKARQTKAPNSGLVPRRSVEPGPELMDLVHESVGSVSVPAGLDLAEQDLTSVL